MPYTHTLKLTSAAVTSEPMPRATDVTDRGGASMSGIRAQQAILSAEFFWFGGTLGAPKVYDAGTSFNAAPTLRDSGIAGSGDAQPQLTGDGEREISFSCTSDGWDVTFEHT